MESRARRAALITCAAGVARLNQAAAWIERKLAASSFEASLRPRLAACASSLAFSAG